MDIGINLLVSSVEFLLEVDKSIQAGLFAAAEINLIATYFHLLLTDTRTFPPHLTDRRIPHQQILQKTEDGTQDAD